jgi:hypothetical protein
MVLYFMRGMRGMRGYPDMPSSILDFQVEEIDPNTCCQKPQ